MQAKTKLGPHLLLQGNSDATFWIQNARPSVVKLVDTGIPGEFINQADQTIWIGRKAETVFDPNNPAGGGFSNDPVEAAGQYVTRFLDRAIRAEPLIQCWELNNEPVITDPTRMAWFARFLARGAQILRETYNKTAVLGCWSVGNPDFPLWAQYGPALEAARTYGALLGRHAYAGPDQSTWSFLLLRHREDNARFAALGFPNMPLVITECGADAVPFGTPQGKPWRELYGDDARRYANEILIPFEAELLRDSYVLGATVFTYGFNWERHTLNGADAGRQIATQVGGRAPFTVNLPTPGGTPPPPDEPPPTPAPTGDMKILNLKQLQALVIQLEESLQALQAGLDDVKRIVPLYEAEALRDLTLRDENGAGQGIVKAGQRVFVYAGPLDIGGFTRRAAIAPLQNRPLLNVWLGESDEPGQATLKRL